jgi:hypothetical protein
MLRDLCSFVLRAAAAVGLVAAATSGAAAEFVVEDIEICPNTAYVLDPEFDANSLRMAFVDTSQRLRVLNLTAGGLSKSKGCSGQVVDTGAVSSMPDIPLRNGPEWGISKRGAELYYTKLDANGTPNLAHAWQEGGAWQTELLPSGAQRGLPLTSQDRDDPQTRLLYVGMHPTGYPILLWRESTLPDSETFFPGSGNPDTGSSPRWIPGQRAISTFRFDADGVAQAARYFIDTGTPEILTSGPGNKDEIWMWSAPEFGGDLVFITVVDGCCLKVFRQNGNLWHEINRIDAATFSKWPHIFSPEPFIYKGRSYVAMQLSRLKLDVADIWIAAVDPDQPLLRQISDPNVPLIRGEPEWLALQAGAFVYYSTFDARRRTTVRRAATGL